MFQQVYGARSKLLWKHNTYCIGETSFKGYLAKVRDIQQQNNTFSSPDAKDCQTYTWQVTALLWLAGAEVLGGDTVFGKLIPKMPKVSKLVLLVHASEFVFVACKVF